MSGEGFTVDVELISRAAVLRMLDENGVVFRGEIEKIPAVDAVPVVRCRDCKHSIENAKHIDVACEWSSDPDFYCAAGERRDSE